MKTVYIASPYTLGDKLENVHVQIDMAEQLSQYGVCPFWPLHSHYWHERYPHGYQFWMDMDFAWVKKCDMLLRLSGKSSGADKEVALAKSCNIPVYYSIEQLVKNEGL